MNTYTAGNYVTYINKAWIVSDISAYWTYLVNPVTGEKDSIRTCYGEGSPIQLMNLPKCEKVWHNRAWMWKTLKGHLVYHRMAN